MRHNLYLVCLCMHVALKKDLELTRSKFNETSEKLMEKSRQYQKLQVLTSVPGLACCMRQVA